MLNSVDAIVEAVGGPSKAAELAGVGVSAVSNWKADGGIPSRHFFAFAEALAGRGLSLDRAVFGFRAGAELRA